MKKNFLIYVFATLLVGVVFTFSCAKEEATNDAQGMKLKSASVDCGTCVNSWLESLTTYGGWVKFNKPGEKANIALDVYNDATNVYYKVYRPSGTFGEVWVDGVRIYLGAGISTYSWQVALAEGWKACDPVTCSVELRGVSGGTGRSNNQSITYYLREKCADSDCEESFTYIRNENNSYTFTYTPEEDMDAQSVVFTFAQGTIVTGLDGWSINGVTYQKTMNFTKCEPVSWTVTLTPDCSGHSPQSNVWTDFKVGDDSKKGTLDNIVLECPENK